ncbi:hypothetical protein FRX31_009785 [Thalictrum thalictroides]|uniref:Uncharacterized protein n=1 Tax=Thalictrum thalictroides TaxID=46969 RepID=A0A7J6WV74_THATH|nr:hypothetical protein FRX31_009785 [Thalictrum thalictroides]
MVDVFNTRVQLPKVVKKIIEFFLDCVPRFLIEESRESIRSWGFQRTHVRHYMKDVFMSDFPQHIVLGILGDARGKKILDDLFLIISESGLDWSEQKSEVSNKDLSNFTIFMNHLVINI